MINEPTDKQIKEFWEWCGLKYDEKSEGYTLPSGHYIQFAPPIDLKNLFKYAPDYQQVIFQPGYCGITIENKLYEGSGDTEEDALFQALDKVRDGQGSPVNS